MANNLLLHLDGNLTDSGGGHNITMAQGGSPSYTTGKFSQAVQFDALHGNSILVPYSTEWQFGTGDFTMDFWWNADSSTFFAINGQIQLYSISGDLHIGLTGGTGAGDWSTGYTYSTINTWKHIALVQYLGTTNLYIDGISVWSAAGKDWSFGIGDMRFGNDAYSSYFSNSLIDEIRVVKGTAAWTSNFTPPNQPYFSPASISIGNAAVTEGVNGTQTLSFTVTQDSISATDTTFDWLTTDGTAISTGGTPNFTAVTNTLATIPAGETTVSLNVTIHNGIIFGSDKAFTATISNPTGATIGTSVGTGTIHPMVLPTLSISSPTIQETTPGNTTLVFVVTQSATLASYDTTFNWSTANITALAGINYTQVTGAVGTIAAGNISTNLDVTIIGGVLFPSDITFSVTISNPTNATISGSIGTGTIQPIPLPPGIITSVDNFIYSRAANHDQNLLMDINPLNVIALEPIASDSHFTNLNNIRYITFVWKQSLGAIRLASFKNDGSNMFPQEYFVIFNIHSQLGTWVLTEIHAIDYDGRFKVVTGINVPITTYDITLNA